MDFDNSIEKTLNEIQKVMSANSIVGNPIKANDKVIIPISKSALGFGVGVGNNAGNSSTEFGGAGGGGSIDPVALVIVYTNIPGPQGVEVLPIDKSDTTINDLLSTVGNFVPSFMDNSNLQPASDDQTESNIDKIKTKIKPSKSD